MVWSRRSILRLFMANLVGEVLCLSRMVRPASWLHLHIHFTCLLLC